MKFIVKITNLLFISLQVPACLSVSMFEDIHELFEHATARYFSFVAQQKPSKHLLHKKKTFLLAFTVVNESSIYMCNEQEWK